MCAEKPHTNDKQHQWHPEGEQGQGQKLGTVTRFTYHISIVSDDGSKPKDPWGFHKLL